MFDKSVRDIMQANVISLAPDSPLPEVLSLMSENRISFIVIASQEKKPLGVITERDVLKYIWNEQVDELQASDVMSSPVFTILADEDVMTAIHKLVLHNIRHLVVVDKDEKISGVLTLTNFLQKLSFEYFVNFKDVREAMDYSPLTLPVDMSALDAMPSFSKSDASCLIVMEEDRLAGIFTERDVLIITHEDRNLTDTSLRELMVSPVITVQEDCCVVEALLVMNENKIRHLPVINSDGKLSGLIKQIDITKMMELKYTAFLKKIVDEQERIIIEANEHLEEKIAERTSELTRANERLQREVKERKKAEDALQESEAKYRQLIEGLKAEHFFYTHDVDGVFTYMSPSIQNVLGYQPEEYLIHYNDTFTDNPINQIAREKSEASIQGKRQPTYEVEVSRKDNSICSLAVTETPVFNKAGEVIAVDGIAHDITERKQVEEALHESEERFRMAFEHAPIGMVCNDGRGRFLQVNPAFCRMVGYSKEEFLKLGVADITHPDDRKASLDYIQKVNNGQLDVLGLEKRYICKDGRIIWGAVNSCAVNDAQGSHLYQLGQIQDISERKLADQAFQTMMETIVGTTGQAFFDNTVRSLCDLLGAECAIIGEIENGDHVWALAMQLDGKIVEGHEYDLPGTPCSNVVAKGYCAYPEGLCELFPDDKDLAEMKAEAYVGVPLRDQHGETVGVLCVISSHKLSLPSKTQEIFEIIAVKAAAEIERKQAEEGLLLYETTVSTFTDMLAVLDKDFVYIATNPAYLAAFDMTHDEVVGNTVSEVFGEEFFNEVIRPQAERCLGGEEVNYQAWFDFPAFEPRYMDIHYYPYTSKTGELVGFIVNARNITEQKQAEEALTQSEKLYQSLVDTMNEGLATVDENGLLNYANEQFCRILGYPMPEIIGEHWTALYDEGAQKVIEEQLKKRAKGSSEPYELENTRKDGNKIWLSISPTPIYDEDGNVKGSMGLVQDITELKQAEEAQLKALREVTNIMESVPDLIYMLDLEGRLVNWNKSLEEKSGYSADELKGKPALEVMHQEDRKSIAEGIEECFEKGGASREARLLSKEGNTVLHFFSAKTMMDEEGKILGLVGSGKDISDLKRTEEALRENEEKFRSIFNNAQVGLFQTRISDGKLLECNERLAQMFGYKDRNDCISHFVSSEQYLDSGTRGKMLSEIKKKGEINNFEAQLSQKDGAAIWVRYSAKLYLDKGYIEGVATDITELKQAEEELRKSEIIHRLTLSNISDAVFITDPAGRFTFICPNIDNIFGFSLNEMVANSYNISSLLGSDLFEPDELEKSGEISNIEQTITDKAGEEHNLLINIKHVSIGEGSILYTCRDITKRKQAEEALALTQVRHEEAQRIAHLGHWELDLIKNDLIWSDESYRIFGVEPGSANTYETFLETMHPDDYEFVDHAYMGSVENRTPYDIEHRLLMKDGSIKWVHERCETEYADDGSPLRSMGTTLDITKRKKVEAALIESERRYRSFIESTSIVAWITDQDGKTSFISSRVKEIYGYTPDEIIAAGEELWFDRIHPDDRKTVQQAFQALFYDQPYFDVEYRIQRKDGKWIWLHDRASLVVRQDGKPQAYGVFSDVTGAKHQDEVLIESETRFRGVFESKMIGNIFWNADGDITGANDAFLEMVGYTEDEVLSGVVRWADMTPPQFKEQDDKALQEIADTGITLPFEKEYIRKDGTRIPVLVGAASMPGSDLNGAAFVIDITERKQAEKDIRESEEKYRNLMQHAQDAIFIADGESGILIDTNKSAEKLIGLPRENIIGMHHSQLHPETETERYKELFRDRVESGDRMVSEPVELHVQHLDGSKIPIEISAGVIEVGGKKLVQGIFHDITRRKKAADSVSKSEKKYSTLIESTNDGVAIVQDMQFKFCNRAMSDITGYSLDELQGMNYLTPIDADFRELVSERYRQRLDGENPPDQYALRFVCKDGTFKEIEASSIRRSRYEDRPAITVTYRDITEQRRAQDEASRLLGENRRLSRQLMQSQEDERRYIARELHDELGQSLTAITTASRLISLRSKEEGVIDKADEIGHITTKLFKDVRNMLVKIRPPMLDSVGLSASLQNLTSHWMKSSGIVCTLNIIGKLDTFPDVVNIAIYRVLQECLTNISRHSEADQVDVSLCRVAQKNEPGQFEEVLQLDVRDNGKGMNLEMSNAMGLGMIGMRERANALGGSCVFNSSPGQGMHTFVLIPKSMGQSEE